MSRITKSARMEQCQVRLPMVCNFDPATVVLAHANGSAAGKGMHQKALDYQGAYACFACHDVYDRRTPLPAHLTREQVKLYFLEGVLRTQRLLEAKELLVAA